MTLGFAIGLALLAFVIIVNLPTRGAQWDWGKLFLIALTLCGGGAAIGYIIERIAS